MRITPRGGGYLGAESYEHVLIFVRDTNQFSFINITLAKEKANFPPDGAILPFVQPTFKKVSAGISGKNKKDVLEPVLYQVWSRFYKKVVKVN